MKITALFLFCLLVLCNFLPAAAQDPTPEPIRSGDWSCIENETGITLSEYRGSGAELVIPEEIEGSPVTQLEKELFKDRSELESVFIPDSVTVIGANAFSGCSRLKNVRLSNSLKRIDTGTFRYCINLETIELPFSLTSIGNYAFADCIRLKEILLLTVTNIGDSAFENCQSLTSVFTTRKLTTVGPYAFRDTAWLVAQNDEFVFIGNAVLILWNGTTPEVEVPFGTTAIANAFADNFYAETVILPETVKQIGASAFRDAVKLRVVNIPEYVTSIGGNAFNGCLGLESLKLPQGLKTIGYNAFSNSGLKELVIPPLVTSIPGSMAVNCPALGDVVIPKSITTFGTNVFMGSTGVRLQVARDSEAERYAVENDIPYSYTLQQNDNFVYSREEDGIRIVRYTGRLYDVEVPAEIEGVRVRSIGEGAFQNNSKIRRVILPLTITEIGDWAFSYMDGLEYIQLPLNLSRIGTCAFTGSEALKQVRIPDALETLGEFAFDLTSETMICAAEDSEAARLLGIMGYDVQPLEACPEDSESMALWAELDLTESDPSTCVCDCPQQTSESPYDEITMIRLPDGLTKLDAELLQNAGNNVLLYIPSTVTEISEDILDGRTLTFVAEAGSTAEIFARQQIVRFLVKFDTLISGN